MGRDRAGRALRVSSHPEIDRVVLSVWQGSTCVATFRLASADVPDLVRALTAALVDGDGCGAADAEDVHDRAC
ncbi:hypothetical protein CLV92_11788 [Kineococcus xinjiangensis]|uniref:Uncharacterized protein n=1 Tax=Kineococcus xinjiangensis TaxID=512762 RepID=A0A2S6ID71_9ACTN|nr:hypothetical protein CLV92_11788 [Kineococcus xinjiangensis]